MTDHCDHCAELADHYRQKSSQAEAELAECQEYVKKLEQALMDEGEVNEYTFEIDNITVSTVSETIAWALLQNALRSAGEDDPKLYASLISVKPVKSRCPEHGAPDVGTGYYECGCAV